MYAPFDRQKNNRSSDFFFNKHLQTKCTKKDEYQTCKPTIDFFNWTKWLAVLIAQPKCVIFHKSTGNIFTKSTLRHLSITTISLDCHKTIVKHKYFSPTHSVSSTFSCHTVLSAELHNYFTGIASVMFLSIKLEYLWHPNAPQSNSTKWDFTFLSNRQIWSQTVKCLICINSHFCHPIVSAWQPEKPTGRNCAALSQNVILVI